MLRRLRDKWKQYKYRFVPWITFNLQNRSVRAVENAESDKVLSDEEVEETLCTVFQTIDNQRKLSTPSSLYHQNLDVMKQVLGFVTVRKPSLLPSGGTGVFVTEGNVKAGTVVSLYPGAIYYPFDPVLFQSLANPFIFRCIDGILIDGNDAKLSKSLYKSCAQRDRIGPYLSCDMSWLTQFPVNPLAVGQYVNNQSKRYPANVAYQEFDVPVAFPFHLRKYIPNVFYRSSLHYQPTETEERLTRMVVLVSLRDISAGEELFSSYFTVVH